MIHKLKRIEWMEYHWNEPTTQLLRAIRSHPLAWHGLHLFVKEITVPMPSLFLESGLQIMR